MLLQNILLYWKQYLSTDPETISGILWFNKHIDIALLLTLSSFHKKNINFVEQLIKWQTLKDEYHLDNDMYFQWAQLLDMIMKNQ